jgi:LysR family transcriptional regulator, glycine cleavage system transcriptional activator
MYLRLVKRAQSGRESVPPLPPLTALRAFEATARHLSFTRAAEELCVTQTAISHQVKILESHLGALLFKRMPRRLALTREGLAWANALEDVFGRLHDANRRLRIGARADRPVVSVSVIPSFAARWLVPRLGRFLERHPGLDVRVSPTEDLVDFAVEAVDLGVRYGAGRYPGLVTEKLADDTFVVVCAPACRARRKLVAPEDLRHHVLLHDDARDAWARWLDARKVSGVEARRGTELSDSSMLVEAAVRGQGVALARWSLAMDDLAAGRLVLPFPKVAPMPTGRSYYLAAPKENLARPSVAKFRDWIRKETSVLRKDPRGLSRTSP